MVEGYRSFFAHLEKSTKLFQFEWKWHCLNCRAENWPTPVALRRALGWLDKLWMRLALTELSDRGPCVYIIYIYIYVWVYICIEQQRESRAMLSYSSCKKSSAIKAGFNGLGPSRCFLEWQYSQTINSHAEDCFKLLFLSCPSWILMKLCAAPGHVFLQKHITIPGHL